MVYRDRAYGRRQESEGRWRPGGGQCRRCSVRLPRQQHPEFWTYGPIGTFSNPLAAGSQPKNVQGQSAVHTSQFALRIAPNPFTTTTSISYSLPNPGDVSLKLYDITGKLVSTLAGGYHSAGNYSLQLTANSSQQKLAAGIYVMRLDSDSYHATEKLIIE